MGEVARIVEPERSAVTPMQMLQIAIEKGASLDALERLMALQERWEANEARKAFVEARAAFKSEAPSITKNKHVGFKSKDPNKPRTDYDHATLDNVADTLSPMLAKHGLSYSWDTEQLDGGLIRVTCVLQHVLGHSERVSLQATSDQSGNKNHIQAIGSAVTFLQRYTLLAVCGVATKGQDDGAGGPDPSITDEQKQTLVDLMREVDANTAAFLKWLGVATIDVLPAARFDEARVALERKRRAK